MRKDEGFAIPGSKNISWGTIEMELEGPKDKIKVWKTKWRSKKLNEDLDMW